MTAVSRIRDEGGYSLIEMLVTMAILGTVMAAVTTLFVTGTKAEIDMNERFTAQQEARLALTKMRREVHCASSAQGQGTANGSGYYTHVLVTLASYCNARRRPDRNSRACRAHSHTCSRARAGARPLTR